MGISEGDFPIHGESLSIARHVNEGKHMFNVITTLSHYDDYCNYYSHYAIQIAHSCAGCSPTSHSQHDIVFTCKYIYIAVTLSNEWHPS